MQGAEDQCSSFTETTQAWTNAGEEGRFTPAEGKDPSSPKLLNHLSDILQETLIKRYSVPFAVADGQDSTPLVRVLRFGHPLPRMVLNRLGHIGHSVAVSGTLSVVDIERG